MHATDSDHYADGCHLSPCGMQVFCKQLQKKVEVRPRTCTHASCVPLPQSPAGQAPHHLRLQAVRGGEGSSQYARINKHTNQCQETPIKGGDGGALAESLLKIPVRPAWGKGFGWGGFSKHLWKHLPHKDREIAPGKP